MPTDAASKARRARRRNMAFVTVVLLVAATILGAYGVEKVFVPKVTPAGCRIEVGSDTVTYAPDQAQHAATIVGIGRRRGLPPRAMTIALATAMQESKLRNLDHGDRDSLGLFQQRPSQGWGTPAQLQDPVYATEKFYDHLVKVDGYLERPLTDVAQDVQRSGYPEAYAKHEARADFLTEAFTGAAPAAVTCRLDDATTASSAPDLVGDLKPQLGVSTRARGGHVTAVFQQEATAWAAAHWAVAHADRAGIVAVSVGDRTWTRAMSRSAGEWALGTAGHKPTEIRIDLAP